jgi:hypothetical protein
LQLGCCISDAFSNFFAMLGNIELIFFCFFNNQEFTFI